MVMSFALDQAGVLQLSVTDCLNGWLVMELAMGPRAFPKVFHFAHQFIILGTKPTSQSEMRLVTAIATNRSAGLMKVGKCFISAVLILTTSNMITYPAIPGEHCEF
jgi:hypothetical protein